MPRKVDADERRRHVVEALFRVAVRNGLAGASLRSVADEARLNIGSVRHYFDSQLDLMRFAMQAMLDRVGARTRGRLNALDPSAPYPERIQHAVDVLSELLPLDPPRRDEVIVFLDFLSLSRARPELADLATRTARDSRTAVRLVLAYLTGLAPDSPELALGTEQLTSLLDGLGINAARHPELVSPDTAVRVLENHLRAVSLAGAPAGAGTATPRS